MNSDELDDGPDKSGTQHRDFHVITVIRVHPWVRWWFYVGVICGAVALANIFFRDLTRAQERVILLLGVIFWVLGGLVCWAWEGVTLEQHRAPEPDNKPVGGEEGAMSRYFISPASRQSWLQESRRRGLLAYYLLRHWEKEHPGPSKTAGHLPGKGNHPRVI